MGFAVYATAHAGSARELVASLAGYPLRVPAEEIAGLGLVLSLDAWQADGEVRRRATRTEALGVGPGGGIAIETLADERGGALVGTASVAWLAGSGGSVSAVADELAVRTALLGTVATAVGSDDGAGERLRAAARERGLLA